METRAMETVLMYMTDTLAGTFEQVNPYMEHDIETEGSKWVRTANDIDRKTLKKQIK